MRRRKALVSWMESLESVEVEPAEYNKNTVANVEETKAFLRRMIGVFQIRTDSELQNLAKQLPSDFDAAEAAKER